MLAAAKWVMGIVPGGIVLGALLGAAVDPDMKDAPAPWWRLTGTEPFAVADHRYYVEAGPEDPAPNGYRPDLDYDAEVHALAIPAHELAILLEEPPAIPGEELPTVTYGMTAAENAAEDAEAAAEEAVAAEQPEPGPEPAPAEVRKSQLASAGLY